MPSRPVSPLEADEEAAVIREEGLSTRPTGLPWPSSSSSSHSTRGEAARRYLAGRGLTEDTITAFHIGFAPDSWDSLLAHFLEGKGHSAVRCREVRAYGAQEESGIL
ncbi:MAG: hypothetical protein MZU91_02705 [Desulfosudis oleivorans]|nr:hypothetical protein [Desulfosudis oleivorans]